MTEQKLNIEYAASISGFGISSITHEMTKADKKLAEKFQNERKSYSVFSLGSHPP
jgi:hypothetical protein